MTVRLSRRVLFKACVVALCLCAVQTTPSLVQAAPPTPEESRRAADENRRQQEEQRQRDRDIRQRYRDKSLCLAGTDTVYSVLEKLYAEFRKDREDIPMYLDYTGGGDDVGVRELTSGQAEAALIREALRDKEKESLAKAFPSPEFQPATVDMGRVTLIIITNEANPVSGLTVKQLEGIYRGSTRKWSDIGAAGNEIVRIGTDYPQLSWGMFLRDVLKNKQVELEDLPFRKEGYTEEAYRDFHQKLREKYKATGGKPFAMLATDDKVLAEVAKNKAAIGYCIHPAGKALPKAVRWVPIISEGSQEAIAPSPENVLLGKYPLQVNIRWLISPKASKTCKEFIAYVCSKDASPVLYAVAIFPGRAKLELLTANHLADMKSGKGTRVSSAGMVGGSKAVPELAIEYVKAKAVVQMGYAVTDSDVAAVGAFSRAGAEATSMPAAAVGAPSTAPAVVAPMTPFVVAGGKELLFLADKPSARAMELHGQKWNALGRDANGLPNGTGPAEYLLAGRAAAVIVNPANKIDALTVGQLQAIFGGEVEDWGTLGYSKSQIDGSQIKGSQIQGSQIKAYGLRADDPATGIFEKECLDRYKWRRVVVKKDTAEAVTAVSMDPQAIAFVDLAGIPATGQNIRILSIKLGTGERAKLIQPTPENIKSAMYPLSQRLWLYVHPQASDTARDFVKFIATCGASEASPYADTVRLVMDTYRRHGLVPLADAALQRMAKDAMADAAARAKADAGKGKVGRRK